MTIHCGRSKDSREMGERKKVCIQRHLSLSRPKVVEGIQAGSRMCAESCKKAQLLKGSGLEKVHVTAIFFRRLNLIMVAYQQRFYQIYWICFSA